MAKRKQPFHSIDGQKKGMNSAQLGNASARRVFLPLLIVTYLLLAAAYSAITPAATVDQHNPDENAHMEYVAKIATGHLPIFTDAQHGYEFHQPPLYYALSAPVYLAARSHGAEAAMKAVRFISIGLGALLIYVTFRCISLLFPTEPTLALGTAAFVALIPSNVALSASVTNDALMDLIFVTCLWLLAKVTMNSEEGGTRESLWIGLVIGAGIWTKTSALALFPVVLLVYYGMARANFLATSAAVRSAALSVGVGLLIGLPWLIRNTILYGDPLAQHLFVTAFSNTAQADVITHFIFRGSVLNYLLGVARWTFASFWGVFDSMRLFWGQDAHGHTPSPISPLSGLYELLALLSAVSVVGVVKQVRQIQSERRLSIMIAAFAGLIGVIVFVFLRFILTFFQAQGRYLYPALLPLAFFFVWGWQGLVIRRSVFRIFVGLMVVGLILLNLYTLIELLMPRYA